MSLIQARSPDGKTAIFLAGGPDYNLVFDYVDDPPVDCTYIFAHRIIFSPSTIKARDLHLHCSTLVILGESCVLTLSGINGVQNITANDTHASGSNAFSIWLSAAEFQVLHSLIIKTIGGDGATGFSSPDPHSAAGAGGNAGNGGDVNLLFNTTYDIIADSGDAIVAAPDSAQKNADMQMWAKLAQSVSQPNAPDGISWVFKMQLDSTQPDMDPEGPLPHKLMSKLG